MRSKLGTEVLIGLALVATLVVVLLGVRFFDGLPLFAGVDAYVVRMDDTGGLVAGSEVLLNGVPVGRVTTVAFDVQTASVQIDLTVNDGTPILDGTVASVGGLAALGSVTLDLVAPAPGAALLPPGSLIPVDPAPSILTTASDAAPLLLGRLDTLSRGLQTTLEAANLLLTDPNSDARATLAELRRTTAVLARIASAQEQRLDAITANTQTLTAALARDSDANADTLAAILRNLSNASARTDRALADLEPGLQALARTSQRLDSVFVGSGGGNVASLLGDTTLYVRLDSSLTSLDLLIRDFRANPGRYLRHLELVDIF
jgi:phospholipid/cholesterol/gamma-HCH transport system substrate-binding protein